MSVNEELCQYLKDNSFGEFMDLWKEQYQRYGKCGGTIHLPLTDINRDTIELFMGKDYHTKTNASITYKQLIKVIETSKFEGADFNIVLQLYFNEELKSNKEVKKHENDEFDLFLSELCNLFLESKASLWLQSIVEEKNSTYIHIKQDWRKDKTACYQVLFDAMKATNYLPVWKNDKENIAVFASRITGNPHAFDTKNPRNYYLIQAICFHFHCNANINSEIERSEILYVAGLYHDSISNYCSVAHINMYQSNGELHRGWMGFYENYEAFNATRDNLEHISAIDYDSCSIIFVVENPSVFQALVRRAKEKRYLFVGFVCTNGQVNATTYRLLDLVSKANIKMYYAGDMDPEGLLIADRLKQRYVDSLELWHYTIDDYHAALSSLQAETSRLKQCDKLIDKQLIAIAGCLLEGIGYQENIMQTYVEDLDKICSSVRK